MIFRPWIKVCLTGALLGSLAFWGWHEAVVFRERGMPRLLRCQLWPDAKNVAARAMFEKLNIHMPDFPKLSLALSGKGAPEDRGRALEAGLKYARYIEGVLPDRFDAYLLDGVCAYNLGRPAEAERALKQALFLKPDFFWTYYDLGMLYFNSGLYQAARGFLEGALFRLGGHDERTLSQSKILMDLVRSSGDVPSGRARADVARDIRMALAVSCFFLGDHACAGRVSEAAWREMGDAEFLILGGASAFQAGDDGRAVRFLTEALVKDPSRGEAHFFLALSLQRMGDLKGSALHYRRAEEAGFHIERFLTGITFPLKVY